jgi:hypothetical protein
VHKVGFRDAVKGLGDVGRLPNIHKIAAVVDAPIERDYQVIVAGVTVDEVLTSAFDLLACARHVGQASQMEESGSWQS